MLRRLRIAVTALVGLLGVGLVVYGLALRAMREVQPFYAAATQAKAEELESAGRRLQSRVSALYRKRKPTGLRRPQPSRRWQTVFTDAEVNGWLAVNLKEKYGELLPPGVSEPRVAFSEGVCKLGYQYDGKKFSTVISVEGEAFMVSKDVAAIRFRRAWAGALPLPMARVVKEITTAVALLELPLRWAEQDDDPVLLIPVADALSTSEELRRLEQLELRDGELRLAGSTAPRLRGEPKVARRVEAGIGG